MATPKDALDYAKRFLGNVPIDSSELIYRILDDSHKKLWSAAAWRWSVGTIAPFQIPNEGQEVDVAAANYTDFGYLLAAHITTGEEKHDLVVVGSMPAIDGDPVESTVVGRPSQVYAAVESSDIVFRFLPVPVGYQDEPWFFGVYKKVPVTIASGNVASDYTTTTKVPDQWFWVYQEIVLAKAMAFINHPRTGSVTYVDGKAQYTGQLGVVEAAIQEMRMKEPIVVDALGKVIAHG